MNKLTIALENCYGIRHLQATLDYSQSAAVGIYAPNGAMKSSLATTFQDIADGKASKDRVFPARTTSRVVQDETGADLDPRCILVLRPYEEVQEQRGEVATLLVNPTLRQEYETLHADIKSAKANLLSAVKAQAQTKRDVAREISLAFTASDDQLDVALKRIKDEITADAESPFATVPYDKVMDEKVLTFLEDGVFRVAIDDYVKKYNDLLAKSKFFKKGAFNYFNAASVANQLNDTGFFEAKHTVNLNGDERVEISSKDELAALIKAEKDKITEDAELRKTYEKLEKQISKNVQLRDFEAYLQEHEFLLPELANPALLKERLWKSYLGAHHGLFMSLLEKMQAADIRAKEIEERAKAERSLWHEVIDTFNDRFIVPFRLEVANKMEVTLGLDTAPRLGFVFSDADGEEAPVPKADLLQTLSTGERKAFYVLNMLFDIAVRRQRGAMTLVVVDDIADSFDYKNKYAIVQYLSDLAEDPNFKLLILTHNFDFYRTIESRKLVQRKQCFMVSKTATGVTLQPAVGIKNVFVNLWKPGFFTEPKMAICCVPFMRNLIEYTKGETDPDYLKLTSLLHWKPDTATVSFADIAGVYGRLFATGGTAAHGASGVFALIESEAAACMTAPDGMNFENKVVLAIATRLKAEQFMANKINDAAWLSTVHANQTPVLLKRYRNDFANELASIKVLQRVTLMTPENIHLNSFMYEPILDMSDQHLRRLYGDVIGLA